MKGFRFYAIMPEERRSKAASKKYPHQPWTVGTLENYANKGRYVMCMAVLPETGAYDRRCGDETFEAAAPAIHDVANSICSTAVSRSFISKRCTRVSEDLARRLHPELFEYLESDR